MLDSKKEHAQGQGDDYWGEGNVLSRGIHGQQSIEAEGKAYVALGDFAAVQEKAMATHSSTLAWKIPWMEEPGRLQSMRSLRVGHY